MQENDWQLLRYLFFWLVLPFKVSLSFYGNFRKWEEYFKNTWYNFSAIISFALLQSSCFNFYVHLRSICLTPFTKMRSLNRYEKVKCENCGIQITKFNLARHKKICSAGTLCCTQCPISSQKHKVIWITIMLRSTAHQNLISLSSVNFCYQEFPGFYALRQHRNTQHGMQIGSGTRDVDEEHIVGDVEDHRLREELRSCQPFLVD